MKSLNIKKPRPRQHYIYKNLLKKTHNPEDARLKSRFSFSKANLLVFVLVFGAIGAYILLSGQAATQTKVWDTQADFQSGTLSNTTATSDGHLALTPTTTGGGGGTLNATTSPTFGSFESGNLSEFSDSTCHPEDVAIISSGAREGGKYAEVSADQNTHCYGDNANVRIHMLGLPSSTSININDGSTFWWTTSMRVPSSMSLTGWYSGIEIHQDSSTIPVYCGGPAPFGIAAANNQWKIIVRGATNCANSAFIQHAFGAPDTNDGSSYFSTGWANGVSLNIVRDQWYDFMLGWHMASDNSGWFEAWVNGPGTNGQSINIVPRQNMPTDYAQKTNFPMLGAYYPTQSGTFRLDFDGGRFSADFNGLKAWQDSFTHSWGTAPGGTTTYPSSGTDVLSFDAGSSSTWSNLVGADSKPSGTNVTYEARSSTDNSTWSAWNTNPVSLPAGRYLQVRATLSTTNSTVTPSVDKISIDYAPVSSSTPIYNGSNISAGQTLSGTVNWTVSVSGSVASVEFWANGAKLATDTTSPYAYNLDTTTLANGANTLGLAVVGTDGSRQTPQIGQVTIDNTVAVTPPQYLGSSISAGQTLSGTVSWTVNTSGSVASVEFWANNVKLSTDTTAPYSYSLNTTTLANGVNTLGLAVVGTDGSRQTPQIGQVTVNNIAAKTGDLNSDNAVNILDLSVLLSHYGQAATTSQGDLNSDGTCDLLDLSILLSHWRT